MTNAHLMFRVSTNEPLTGKLPAAIADLEKVEPSDAWHEWHLLEASVDEFSEVLRREEGRLLSQLEAFGLILDESGARNGELRFLLPVPDHGFELRLELSPAVARLCADLGVPVIQTFWAIRHESSG